MNGGTQGELLHLNKGYPGIHILTKLIIYKAINTTYQNRRKSDKK